MDLVVHRGRVQEADTAGKRLIGEVSGEVRA